MKVFLFFLPFWSSLSFLFMNPSTVYLDSTLLDQERFGVCHLSVIPLRVRPDQAAEMTSQLLFGEYFQIREEHPEWVRIRAAYDHYEGWIQRSHFILVDKQEYEEESNKKEYYLSSSPISIVKNAQKETFYLSAGSPLPKYKNNIVRIGNQEYAFEGKAISTGSLKKTDMETVFKLFLNTPYLWGGRNLFGMDCSGFMQVAYRMLGVKLKRDAYEQAEQGVPVSDLKQAVLGDLAFFDSYTRPSGKITHVGALLSNQSIIHESGKVHVDRMDSIGIYSEEIQSYTHRLISIRRVPE